MKIHAAAISSPLANSGSPTVSAEGVRESAGGSLIQESSLIEAIRSVRTAG